jgi:hypothetical protein
MTDLEIWTGRPGAGATEPISEEDAFEILRGILSALAMLGLSLICWAGC